MRPKQPFFKRLYFIITRSLSLQDIPNFRLTVQIPATFHSGCAQSSRLVQPILKSDWLSRLIEIPANHLANNGVQLDAGGSGFAIFRHHRGFEPRCRLRDPAFFFLLGYIDARAAMFAHLCLLMGPRGVLSMCYMVEMQASMSCEACVVAE